LENLREFHSQQNIPSKYERGLFRLNNGLTIHHLLLTQIPFGAYLWSVNKEIFIFTKGVKT